jgi:Methionine aminopeptidase
MVEIKTPAEVEAMRGPGRVVAEILAAVQDQAKAGMRTAELDEIARDVLARNGAYSPFLNYQPGFAPVPFPATICTSVNDAALHGIPGRYKLADGDLLSVDCGAVLDGWTGDAAVSFTIGTARPADERLIDVTRDALRAGIAAAVPAPDRGHLRRHRRGRPRGRLRNLHRLRRSRRRPDHARGPVRPQRGRPAAAAGLSPGWSSPSSPGSWPAAGTCTGSTATAGRSAAATAAGPRTPSTRWPSPRPARRS